MCEYCEYSKPIRDTCVRVILDNDRRTLEVYEYPSGYERHVTNIKINYCPMCGRDLGGDAS